VHKQPVMETCLRSVLADSPSSELRTSCTITSIDQDEDWAYSRYHDKQGKEFRIRSNFLVGADGKTGFTRKIYLESKGVKMERMHP
jgi:2-polyprenyl-6-methoxyphenol hydroxylase-like FAD-dependent oxidoreductase